MAVADGSGVWVGVDFDLGETVTDGDAVGSGTSSKDGTDGRAHPDISARARIDGVICRTRLAVLVLCVLPCGDG